MAHNTLVQESIKPTASLCMERDSLCYSYCGTKPFEFVRLCVVCELYMLNRGAPSEKRVDDLFVLNECFVVGCGGT